MNLSVVLFSDNSPDIRCEGENYTVAVGMKKIIEKGLSPVFFNNSCSFSTNLVFSNNCSYLEK